MRRNRARLLRLQSRQNAPGADQRIRHPGNGDQAVRAGAFDYIKGSSSPT
jgi:hypothetical protein